MRVLGIVENMAPFSCECGHEHDVFGRGGGIALAEELSTPLLASIPLRAHIAAGGDAGAPAVSSDTMASEIFQNLVELLTSEIAPPAGMTGCTARMMKDLDAAVQQN